MNTTPAPWPQPIEHQLDSSQPRRTSTADIVATALLSVIQLVGSGFVFVVAALSLMMTDGCQENCRQVEATATTAMYVAWGGVAVGALVTIVGVAVAASRRRSLWLWPALGIAIVILASLAGIAILPES